MIKCVFLVSIITTLGWQTEGRTSSAEIYRSSHPEHISSFSMSSPGWMAHKPVCIALLADNSPSADLSQITWVPAQPSDWAYTDNVTTIHLFVRSYLAPYGISDPEIYYDIKTGGIAALKDCYSGGYGAVVIVAHSVLVQPERAILLTNNGAKLQAVTVGNLKAPTERPQLSQLPSQITIVACHSEHLDAAYSQALSDWRSRGTNVNYVTPSTVLEYSTGLSGVRSVGQAGIVAAQLILSSQVTQ